MWAQIDLNQHDLQPMPRGGDDTWPRLALVRRVPAGERKKKRKKRKKKSPTAVKVKLVTTWQWYPTSQSMSDANAISAFIEDADNANWATLTTLPSAANRRLRVVKQKRKRKTKKKTKKKKKKNGGF